jgi:hypothetical protein
MEVIKSDSLPPSEADRPERVVKLHGVIVQSDKTSWLGAWFIRPVEMLDLHLAGIGREIGSEPLAIHAGLHVELKDGRRSVVEQLFETSRENFVNGLNWTPLETFKARDHAGWDVTIAPSLKSLRRSRLPRHLRRKRKYSFHQAFIPANAVLPHLKNRPITPKRYPVGFGS